MIGAPGLRKMQFKKVKNVEVKNKIIAEFLKNRKILRQRLINEKLGKQELAITAERAQRPVTEAVEKTQKQTDEKQDKVIEQLKDNQEKITEAVDTLSEAISKAGSTMPGGVQSYLQKVPDPAFQSDESGLSALSTDEEKRINKIGFDSTFASLPSHEEMQKKHEELDKKFKETNNDRTALIISNQIEALEKYQYLIDKQNRPSTSQPKTIEKYFTQKKIALDPYWFDRDIETTLRTLGIDPTFVKVHTDEDLDNALSERKDTFEAMPTKYVRNQVDVLQRYINNISQIQQKTGTSLKLRKNIKKLSHDNTFGNLYIDTQELVGGRHDWSPTTGTKKGHEP